MTHSSSYFPDAKHYPITTDYDLKDQIGDGGFSVVKKGTSRLNKTEVAIKVIQKNKMEKSDALKEVTIWRLASNKSNRVVKLYDVFEDATQIYLVMELMHGGELFDKIVKMEDYNEKFASTIIKQVLLIIRDLHELDIVHQDMKPENLLLVDKDSNNIKLCDFGLAEIVTDDIELIGLAGSTPYMAPEVIDGDGHGKPVDVYATGVVTYILLCGYPPFEPDNGIVHLEFPSPEWDVISSSAKDFIDKLLVSDPNKRLTAEEALKHPWIKDTETIRENPILNTKNTLRRFKEMSHINPGSSMREYRGGGGGGRESLMTIFNPPNPPNPPEPEIHEEKHTNGAGRRDSQSESSVSGVDTLISSLQKELAKTREKIITMKKETTILRILLAEQTAARMEIESKCKFELDLLKRESEEERRKRKKIQSQIDALKSSYLKEKVSNPVQKAATTFSPVKKPTKK